MSPTEIASAIRDTADEVKVFMHSADCRRDSYEINVQIVGALELLAQRIETGKIQRIEDEL